MVTNFGVKKGSDVKSMDSEPDEECYPEATFRDEQVDLLNKAVKGKIGKGDQVQATVTLECCGVADDDCGKRTTMRIVDIDGATFDANTDETDATDPTDDAENPADDANEPADDTEPPAKSAKPAKGKMEVVVAVGKPAKY